MLNVRCTTRTGSDIVRVYNVEEFSCDLRSMEVLRKNKKEYVKRFGTFDIETTSITHYEEEVEKKNDIERKVQKEKADYAFMYVWSACINGTEVYGRTWQEFLNLLNYLKAALHLSDTRYFVIYIHNLPFEFSFLQGYITDYSELFATGERKPLVWRIPSLGIEFRCSLRLTNQSLEKFTQTTTGCNHIKAKGDLDYKLVRTNRTRIEPVEWGYIINDTLGLWEALTYKMEKEGDTITTIPLTSTGYVRREVKRSTSSNKSFLLMKKKCALNEKQYNLIKQAFRGGDTHANSVKCGMILSNVYSYDASSMYPAMMLLRKYPIKPWRFLPVTENIFDDLKGTMWCATIKLTNVRMKDNQFNPYLSISKCKNVKGLDSDNGRIWACDELTTTILDIDYEIIDECYDYDDIEFLDGSVMYSYGDYLPECVRQVIMKFFSDKTNYKLIVKETIEGTEENDEANRILMLSKALLNAIYGMAATDPVHELIEYNGEWNKTFTIDNDKYKDNDSFYKEVTEKAVLPYAWGAYVTAYARQHLRKALKCAGTGYVYCDTDSVKATEFDFEALKELNESIYAECEKLGAYVDTKKGRQYIGYFDGESKLKESDIAKQYCYRRFITLGAKKYGGEKYTGKGKEYTFEITISGVSKDKVKDMSCIENFKPGYKFVDSGGFNVTYCDNQYKSTQSVVDYHGIRSNIEFTGYACFTHREYEIGLSKDQWLRYKVIDVY